MILIKWNKLPIEMQTDEVRKYYDILSKKRASFFLKRVFDVVASLFLLLLFLPLFLTLAIIIKIDSRGPVFYRQARITQYGKVFYIHKFRTMVVDADRGSQITLDADKRITRVGKCIRKLRIDEISQLLDVFVGNMTFVGTRPEVKKFVEQYSPEMKATLLLPAGITSEASIYFKDEAEMLKGVSDTDKAYVEDVLPKKMGYNLRSLEKFGFWHDIGIMFKTAFVLLGKKYKAK